MKYLQICQMLKNSASTDMPQANMRRNKLQKQASVNQQLISVQTDLYHLWINPKGGDIVRIELLKHDESKDSNQPFVMLESDAKRTYVAQSGLIGLMVQTVAVRSSNV
jgi:YidC/Oxa1 family membrane protein insertase